VQNVERDVSVATAGLGDLEDSALLARARSGDQEAYAALFSRYAYAAHRLARHLGQREDAEDVVAEAFARVLDLVRRGKGPDKAFRAYLFTTIRHESGRRAKARQRVVPTDDESQIDRVVPFGAGALDDFETAAVRSAYDSLPDRWRAVLWHLDIEGRKPQDLGPLLGLSPNSVSALVYRARSGLRQAYLQQHVKVDGAASTTCRAVRDGLSGFVRRTASTRDRERIGAHLETCAACMAVHVDLQEVNQQVGATVTPVAVTAVLAGGGGLATTGLWSTLLAEATLVAKGVAALLAPPVAAAAVTAGGLAVYSSGHQLPAEPQRPPTSVVSAPDVASPATSGRPKAATPDVVEAPQAAALPVRVDDAPHPATSSAPPPRVERTPSPAPPVVAEPVTEPVTTAVTDTVTALVAGVGDIVAGTVAGVGDMTGSLLGSTAR
jgi:RNA polymerase sigma factor (sigma-70 family)